MYQIVFLVVTCLGIGKIKYAPGTWGSAVAFPLAYALMQIVAEWNINLFGHITTLNTIDQQMLSLIAILAIITIVAFIIGVFASNIYMKKLGEHDPKEIIIDELVGQLLVISLSIFTLPIAHYSGLANSMSPAVIDWVYLVVLPFILFRLYDIVKPWPINWMDKNIKGGLGVMLDDIAAAIFAVITHYALLFVVIDIVDG